MPIPTATQWKTYDAKTRQAWLAKMTPDQKNLLRMSLSIPVANPKDIRNPERYAQKPSTARQALDFALDQLPTAGGVAGGMAGAGAGAESGPGAVATGVAGAAAGGTLGEDAREVLGAKLYSDPARREDVANLTAKTAAEKLGTEGVEQGGSELFGSGVSGAFNKLAEKVGLKGAAASAAEAAAGKGVQKTPGEATGNRAQKFLEHFLGYMPGAMGPMGRFEEMRAGQTAAMLEKELDQIAEKKLSREASGDAVAATIERMEKNAVAESNLAYNPLKKPLGLPEGATRAQIEEAATNAAKPHPSGVLDASGKPIMSPGDGGKALRDLRAADAAHTAAKEKIDADIITKLARTNRTEAMHQMIAKSSIKDLRTILGRLPADTRAEVSRNVLEDALNVGRDTTTGAYDAKKALGALATLDKDGPKSELLFGKNAEAVRSALKEIGAIQREHSPGGGMAGHRILTGIIATLAAGGGAGIATGHGLFTLASIGGEMGAARALAYLVTNPETSLKTLMALRKIAAGTVRIATPMAIDAWRQANLPPAAAWNDPNATVAGRLQQMTQ